MIAEGRVSVNGAKVLRQGTRVRPGEDRIEVDGQPLAAPSEAKRYFIFHKPRGVTTTLKDRFAEKTVADFFRDVPEKVVPVGRLDKDSTGLILMTNDGDLVYRLTHPRFEIPRVYRVRVQNPPGPEKLAALEKGIMIEGQKTAPCRVEVLTADGRTHSVRPRSAAGGVSALAGAEYRMTLREGRKREIRDMFRAFGARVAALHRESYGPLTLGKVRSGYRRELTRREVDGLKAFVYDSNPR
jgi:23S rRNA pseudouridine2605 synthase